MNHWIYHYCGLWSAFSSFLWITWKSRGGFFMWIPLLEFLLQLCHVVALLRDGNSPSQRRLRGQKQRLGHGWFTVLIEGQHTMGTRDMGLYIAMGHCKQYHRTQKLIDECTYSFSYLIYGWVDSWMLTCWVSCLVCGWSLGHLGSLWVVWWFGWLNGWLFGSSVAWLVLIRPTSEIQNTQTLKINTWVNSKFIV